MASLYSFPLHHLSYITVWGRIRILVPPVSIFLKLSYLNPAVSLHGHLSRFKFLLHFFSPICCFFERSRQSAISTLKKVPSSYTRTIIFLVLFFYIFLIHLNIILVPLLTDQFWVHDLKQQSVATDFFSLHWFSDKYLINRSDKI